MHVPAGVQPCPSCYAYCVPRAACPGGIPPPPPVPRHAHPPVRQNSPHGSPANSPHHSPHRTQPRPMGHPPPCNHQGLYGGLRFGSLPHSQPVPKVPPHYNSLPHQQPPPPPAPSHQGPCHPPPHPFSHNDIPPPPPPPHASLPPGRPHIFQQSRFQHLPPPEESPPPPPPPHGSHPCQQHRHPLPPSHPQPFYGNLQPGLPPHVQRAHPPHYQQPPHPQPYHGSLHKQSNNHHPASTTSTYSSCYPQLPPPRPPPLPPPLPPPQPFSQLRYGCLPHQQLVPPPPPPLQLQHQHHLQLHGCGPPHFHHRILELTGPVCSPVKVDRPYCGKGPPSNRGVGPGITKSYSVEGAAPPIPPHHLHHGPPHHHHNGSLVRRPQMPQAVSQSSGVGMGGRRQAPRGTAADDSSNRGGRWRGSGAPGTGHGYELSQDLADMRLEMLERRYGGEVARRAAVTIQRAYRHYAMYKKFRSITATAKAQEKRLSRRFTVDVPEWNDTSNQHYHDAEHFIRSEFDQLQRNLSATVYGEGRRPARSLSLRDTPRTTTPATSTTSTRIQQDNHDLHDTLAAMNDSSLYCHVSAHSPLTPTSTPTPAPTHARNGSGDYQHQGDVASYASSRDIKYISSDEGGFGSQDSANMARLTVVNQRRGVGRGKKIPPEVPRRSSSIKSSESSGSVDSAAALSTANHRVQCHPPSLTPPSSTPSSLTSEGGHSDRGALRRSADNGSLSSVQSSGSDSSLSQSTSDRATPLSTHDQVDNSDYHPTSPIWKRKNQQMSTSEVIYDDKRLSNISENSEDSLQSHSSEGMTYSQTIPSQIPHSARYAHAHYTHTPHMPKVPEVVRKRQYRVGLNLFNKKPERGVTYLIGRGFLENSPQAVAKFLLTRKGLSKQMIGEYLGNLQNSFNMAVLECFAQEIDLSGMQVDVALRKFQTHFRMPGEAQKIERLMQVFAQRYCQCNRDIVAKLRDPETIFVLAFAIIMLNTDLHTASMKQEKRMKLEDFIKNLRGIDDGYDIEREMLEGMYQRIKAQEFRPGHDHVTQVLKVQQTMVGKKPNLALPHRRLVCYCRLYEIPDVTKKERVGVHQREVFLFNDLLVVTKIFSKKKNSVTYTFRQSYPLAGLVISTKEVPHYPYLMEVRQRVDNKILIIFNARNEHDRTKFCEDLKESVCEMDEMESLRIEGELEKQKASLRASRPNSTTENRDSGVADMELMTTNEKNGTLKSDSTLKRSALSNSLLDIHEAVH
ncbi:IQ motif and SEC7 domain-containing protein 1-like isoform X4 [Penaeus chinensis]|uniref:IQ motif and SEC7 domain-containing protein 1-like isoform X4 n=1 Tax=Penaeus chinensis TaxID=139456 RepID=UPI001FB574F2|nr:IQ motif and SEC7 domain-containing protein 1-like isoform X4 [Penaeus chinensis]